MHTYCYCVPCIKLHVPACRPNFAEVARTTYVNEKRGRETEMSVTTKGCLLCTWGISLQHFSVQRDYLLVTHISKLLRMFTGLDSKLFVYKLDLTFYYKSPYWRVIWGVYICRLYCIFCTKQIREYFLSESFSLC